MQTAVLNGTERVFEKPKKPNVKQPTPFDIEEHHSGLKECNDGEKRHEQNKAQVLVIVRDNVHNKCKMKSSCMKNARNVKQMMMQ